MKKFRGDWLQLQIILEKEIYAYFQNLPFLRHYLRIRLLRKDKTGLVFTRTSDVYEDYLNELLRDITPVTKNDLEEVVDKFMKGFKNSRNGKRRKVHAQVEGLVKL